MGNVILAASSSKSGGGSYLFLVAIVVLFGLLYFVTIRPQRNRQRAAQATQRNVELGARVRTTAGMYGTVTSLEDQDVVLEIAPGVEVRFLRRAIMDVVPESFDMEAEGSEMEAEDSAPEHSETLDEAEDDAAKGG
jgi:preprotein translocase subunit YajC